MKAIRDNNKAMAAVDGAHALPAVEVFDSTDVKPTVDKNISKWDSSGDGKLNADELNAVLKSGDASSEEKAAAGLRKVFGIVDGNRDGNIDAGELETFDTGAQIYERTRARVDKFVNVASANWKNLDANETGDLSRSELLSFANDKSNSLTEEERQIVREFASTDYNLVAVNRDNKTGDVVPLGTNDSRPSIKQDDLDVAGRKLRTKTVEGHRMAGPGIVHDMYRTE